MILSVLFNFIHNGPKTKPKLGLKYLVYHYLHCYVLEDDKRGLEKKNFPEKHNYFSLRRGSVNCEELRNQFICKKILFFIIIVLKYA